MDTSDKIKTSFPLPIAKLHEEMRLEFESRLRVRKLIKLFEGTSQYVSLIGLSVYINNNYFDEDVEKAKLNLTRPSLGHWVYFLRIVSKYLRAKGVNFISIDAFHEYKDEAIGIAVKNIRELIGLEKLKNIRLNSFLDTMIEFRNKRFGHGELSFSEAESIKDCLEDAINQWLLEMPIFTESKLLYIAEVKLQRNKRIYLGAQLSVGTSLESFQSSGEKDLYNDCVYLHHLPSDRFMPLSPYFVYQKDMQVLYTYSEMSSLAEMRLRCVYNTPGVEDSLVVPVDKSESIANSFSEENGEPVGVASNTFSETSDGEINNTDSSSRSNNSLSYTDQDLEEQRLISERNLNERKKKSVEETWQVIQDRIESLEKERAVSSTIDADKIKLEIEKAKKHRSQIEEEISQIVSLLEDQKELFSKRVELRKKNREDTTQTIDALSVLSETSRQPEILVVITKYRDDFENTRKHINIMRDYKNIHDALHELEFKCFRAILQEVNRFPKKVDFADLQFYLLILSQIKIRIQETVAKGFIPYNEDTLISRLADEEKSLKIALEDKKKEQFEKAVRGVGHVLRYDLARINQRLSNAASSLSLRDLIEGMEQVRVYLARNEKYSTKVNVIDNGIESLRKLDESLSFRTREHGNWQEVNDELRLAESDLQSAVDRWLNTKKRLLELCRDQEDVLVNRIESLCKNLDDLLSEKTSKKTQQEAFKSLNRFVGLKFQEVDGYLKDFYDQIKNLDEPITSIIHKIM